MKGQDHDVSDLESATDGADVPNANEFDEDMKDEVDSKKGIQTIDVNDQELVEVNEANMDVPPPQELVKIEFSANQENGDVVEDCINLNVEDEENFEEVKFQPSFTHYFICAYKYF